MERMYVHVWEKEEGKEGKGKQKEENCWQQPQSIVSIVDDSMDVW